ncbi:acyl-CoA synthetase [Sphingobium sp. JS3065]|uniref:acyl-CoA synthetase n=1 Tax=Sphingobium sp. JS3065 TaxID=2970925 RepID=UPI002263C7B6|nr:acyl-CoA synthetase [Sphingobium sp. JS3065]UZW56005.1 acyl-CoA synthetase [Sphingobium sp. JS3065]
MQHPAQHAREMPDKPAYIMAGTGKVVTYGELDRRSTQIARLFRSLGLGAGDHIALLLPNDEHFMQICWGAQRSGLIYTPISTHLKRDEIGYILQNSDAALLVTSAAFAPLICEGEQAGIALPHLFLVDGAAPGFASWPEAIAAQSDQPIADEQAGARMVYTSGTTGQPKGVLSDFTPGTPIGTMPAKLAGMAKIFGIDEQTVLLSPAPLYHSAPLGFVHIVMHLGGTAVILDKFDAEAALRAIETYRVTHSQWVPIMFHRMLALEERVRESYDLSSHRVAIHAAAPCPVELKRRMIAWWGPILAEYYASTESTGFTAIDTPEWLAHPGSVGRAKGSTIHILDDDGEELPSGEVGMVFFEAAKGRFAYYKDPDKTAASYNDQGWASVGDLGYVDEEGYLYLTDRKSFMIISGGVNIYPQEIENLLLGHPKVADVAVIGIPNEEFGEEVKAVVQPRSWEEAGADLALELTVWCRDRLANLKVPRSFDFERELPRQENGKLYKKLIIDHYLRNHARS